MSPYFVSSNMQIWLYKRECQIGDYVYADASTSDRVNKEKSIVGVCFYINPADKTQRLCVALQELTSYPWGLYSGNWPEGITLADTSEYSVFDVPTLTNKTTGINTSNITEATYRDETSAGDNDGFKILPNGIAAAELGWEEMNGRLGGYPEGTKLPWGLINTLKIIEHRNKILSDTNINLPQPQKIGNQSELSNLIQLMQDVIDKNSGATKYRDFYYPPASQCHSYEPNVISGEILSDCFKSGKWFLPSTGELARLYWWSTHNEAQEPVSNGIFAKHIVEGRFAALAGSYWTSTECNSTTAWYIGFQIGRAHV